MEPRVGWSTWIGSMASWIPWLLRAYYVAILIQHQQLAVDLMGAGCVDPMAELVPWLAGAHDYLEPWLEPVVGARGWSPWLEPVVGSHGWLESMNGARGWPMVGSMTGGHAWRSCLETMVGSHGLLWHMTS